MPTPTSPRTGHATYRWQRVRAAVVAVMVLAATLIAIVSATTALAQPPTTPPPPVAPVPSAPATPAPHWHVEPPTPTPTAPTSPDPQSPTDPGTGTPNDTSDSGDCGVSNISGCVGAAIDGFFQRLVATALNPMLKLISHTLLTTPDLTGLPHVRELWSSSWQLVVAMYGLVVMAAGVLVMVHQSVQTRWSLRELAPRVVLGFLAGAFSMVVATGAIRFANALAQALSGNGVDADSAGAALAELAAQGTEGGTFAILLEVALVVMLVLLVLSYVVRVAVTVILVVAAPLALMCHALPGIEAIAAWWWRSFAACLGIQVVQSLVLVTCLRVFLAPGGWGFFGPNADGLVDVMVALALMGVLVKTPFWLLSAMKIGHGRSFAGSIVRSYITYKTLGLLKGATTPAHTTTTKPAPARRTPKPADPYAKVRATRDGQLMLPLEGVHRVKRKPNPAATHPASTPKPATARSPRGKQLAFDFTPPDPYRGIRPGRGGQYPLPIPVTRVPRAPAPPAPTSPPAKRAATRAARGKQLALDFDPPTPRDPYDRVRPLRGGQYLLPIPVTRVRPAPAPPVPPQPPAAGAKRSSGRQLHLPLPDLPVRRRAPRTPGRRQS